MAALRAATIATVIHTRVGHEGMRCSDEHRAGVGEGQSVDAVLDLDEAGEQGRTHGAARGVRSGRHDASR